MSAINNTDLDTIANSIDKHGYIIWPSFIPEKILKSLQLRVGLLQDSELKNAAVGRGQQQQNNNAIRRDKIHWLNTSNTVDSAFLELMESLRVSLNHILFLGLFDYESHYAVYQTGDFYKIHRDALKGKTNRLLSSVVYLNDNWNKEDAGELVIYSQDEKKALETITPMAGTLVLFLSEQFPHEVLPAKNTRYSIAGWYRVNASSSRIVDPSV